MSLRLSIPTASIVDTTEKPYTVYNILCAPLTNPPTLVPFTNKQHTLESVFLCASIRSQNDILNSLLSIRHSQPTLEPLHLPHFHQSPTGRAPLPPHLSPKTVGKPLNATSSQSSTPRTIDGAIALYGGSSSISLPAGPPITRVAMEKEAMEFLALQVALQQLQAQGSRLQMLGSG